VLAGRVAELREPHGAAVRAAAERRGWAGLAGGEPGIGKTRPAAASRPLASGKSANGIQSRPGPNPHAVHSRGFTSGFRTARFLQR
jgi:hypothetical protein